METIQQIKNHPVYQQVLKDSFGGVMYNVANRGKYEKTELLTLWHTMSASEKESADGIIKGAMHFLQEEN